MISKINIDLTIGLSKMEKVGSETEKALLTFRVKKCYDSKSLLHLTSFPHSRNMGQQTRQEKKQFSMWIFI